MDTLNEKQQNIRREKAEIEARRRFDLQKKAVRIVERLSENQVDEDFFKDCAKFINPDFYNDAVTERSIDKLCGYPLCPNKLTSFPKQKYHISTKTNKVYDITERKCFCSQFCFRASKFYQGQLPTSPLWARSNESRVEIQLLSKEHKPSKLGEAPNNVELVHKVNEEEVNVPIPGDIVDVSQLVDEIADDISAFSLANPQEQKRRFKEFEAEIDKEGRRSKSGQKFDEELKDAPGENKPPLGSVEESVNSEGAMQELSKNENNGKFGAIEVNETNNDTNGGAISICDIKSQNENVQYPTNDVDNQCKDENMQINPTSSEPFSSDDGKHSVVHKTMLTNEGESAKLGQTVISNTEIVKIEKNTGSEGPSASFGNKEQDENIFVQKSKRQTGSQRNSKDVGKIVMDKVEKCLLEWRTERTLQFLKNDDSSSNIRQSTKAKSDTGAESSKTVKQFEEVGVDKKKTLEEKMIQFAEHSIEAVYGDDGPSQTSAASKPVPDMKQLSEDNEMFSLRVKEFYAMQPDKMKVKHAREAKEKFIKEKNASLKKNKTEEETKEDDRPVLLPPVDSKSQMTIRRRIVMDKVHKVLREISAPLGLSMNDFTADLHSLVTTFDLSSNNIIFKPDGWTLVTILLLFILRHKNTLLQYKLDQHQATVILSTILKAFRMTKTDLEKFSEGYVDQWKV